VKPAIAALLAASALLSGYGGGRAGDGAVNSD
jgi:hypothetical protein